MQARVEAAPLPILPCVLEPSEAVWAEPGRAAWLSPTVQLRTTTAGGLWATMRRALGGGSVFLTAYEAVGGPGVVAFTAPLPGDIVEVPLDAPVLVHEHGFVAATPGVQVSVGVQQRLGAGVFGGVGFVLQRLAGPGTAWVALSGAIKTYTLAAGQSLQVHPGHLGMFDATVTCGFTVVRGIRNLLFGDEGVFFAVLTGPGRFWLQSMPAPLLAHALARYGSAAPPPPDVP